jgi:hypothetical protein
VGTVKNDFVEIPGPAQFTPIESEPLRMFAGLICPMAGKAENKEARSTGATKCDFMVDLLMTQTRRSRGR